MKRRSDEELNLLYPPGVCWNCLFGHNNGPCMIHSEVIEHKGDWRTCVCVDCHPEYYIAE